MRVKFVQIDASAYDKAPDLAQLLGISENEALGMLASLWRGVLAHAHHSKKPDGTVDGPARLKLVAAWCKWRAGPEILLESLEALGFVEHLEKDRLRVRGTSRYLGIIAKNSRPNA